MDYAKIVVNPIRQVAKRSTIRGFKDDYYHLDADVVVLAGETHLFRKPVSNSSHSRVDDTQPIILFQGVYAFLGGTFAHQICNYGRAFIYLYTENPWPCRSYRRSHAGTERRPPVDGSAHASRGLLVHFISTKTKLTTDPELTQQSSGSVG
jgi:hypothetical protein